MKALRRNLMFPKISITKYSGDNHYSHHDNNRSGYQKYYVDQLLIEPGLGGKVLDVGCGPDLPSGLSRLKDRLVDLDGLDPNEDEVISHPLLKNRWARTLEDAPLMKEAYDLIYSFNVTEHVANPREFLSKAAYILKPGGIYWALSNHASHPFARIVRFVEFAKLKNFYARNTDARINEYPAYYRLNSIRQYKRHFIDSQFASANFHFYPCMQWDCYFPAGLRPIPHIFDRFLGNRFSPFMMILMVRLQKLQS